MQSKHPPSSFQNQNPKPHIPFEFGPFSLNNLSKKCQGSSHSDSKDVNSCSLGYAIDGGINCSFASPLVSRVSSDKSKISAISGRSRPRPRKQLGSQHGRSTSESVQIDSCMNPFRSLCETSGRVKDANITSNGFSASTGDVKFDSVGFVFGANKSNTGSSSNSERRESGESVGQSNANEFGKFHNVGFVFGTTNKSSMPDLSMENRRYNKSTTQTGANVGFLFDAHKSNLVPNSKSEQRESGGTAGHGGADEFGKLDNLGFVFGANKCDSVSNSKLEQRESNGSVGRSGGNEFRKFENPGFVFGANESSFILNSDLEKREYGRSMGKQGADEFPKFDNVGFVFGANENNLVLNWESEKRESSGSARKWGAHEFGRSDTVAFVFGANRSNLNSEEKKFVFGSIPDSSASNVNSETRKPAENVRKFVDERGKMKEENKAEFMNIDNANFVFGTNHGDPVTNSITEMKKSSERVGKSAPDVSGKNCKIKLDAGADSGNLYNLSYVFSQNWSDLRSNSNLGKRESSKNMGKSVSNESGRMTSGPPFGKFDNVGFVFGANQSVPASDFQKTTPQVVSTFRSRCKKSFSFREHTKLTDGINKVNGDCSGNCDGFAKTHIGNFGSDVNTKCNFVFAGSISTATVSVASPVHNLEDDMKNLNVVDYEKVGDSDKTKNFNSSSCANFNNIFVFGSNKKALGSSTGNSGTTSQIKNSNFVVPRSGCSVDKTDKDYLKSSDKNSSVFRDIKDNACSFEGGVKNMMPDEINSKNSRSEAGTVNEKINLGGPFPMQKQPININEKSSDDSSVGVSTAKPYNFQAGLDKSYNGPQDQMNDDVRLNQTCSPSFFSSVGLGFDATSMGRAENKDEFSFTSMPNSRTPNLDASCSFRVNLFPGLNKKLEFSARSRSIWDRTSKKRGKRHAILVQHQSRQDDVSKEGSPQQNAESPACYSPMDFSPCQCNNCTLSGGSSTVSTHVKDEDLAGAREGDDVHDKTCIELNEKDSENLSEKLFGAGNPSEEFVSEVETECNNTKTEQVSFNCGADVSVLEAGADVGSNTKGEESECRNQFSFASDLEDTGKRDFTFSASSAQDNSSAAKLQYRKKYRMKVGRGSNCTTRSQKVDFASSSNQSLPQAGTSSNLKVALDKKRDISNPQRAEENKFKADGEHSKKESATAAIQEACGKWRIRGNQAYKNGDLSKAEEFYTKGINSVLHRNITGCCLEPLVLCYSNRAATRMSLRRMREALADCTMAAALDPNFLKVQMRAANCHLALGEVDDALQYFSKCLESGREVCLDRRIIIEAADGLQKAQRVAEHTIQCTELLQQRTSSAATIALGIIAEVLPISSYSEKLLEMKGEALFTLRKYEEVIQLCEQTLDFAEKNFVMVDVENDLADGDGSKCKNSIIRMWRWHLMSKSNFHLGRLEMSLNLLEKQELLSSTKHKMNQRSTIPLAVTVRELLHHKNAGNKTFQLGRHIEAVEHYTAAISSSVESHPFAAICFCNRAAAHQALGQIADAIADCSLAIALDGNYAKAVSRRATLHVTIRDYEQAANDLQTLICVLENQSQEKVQQSGTPNGSIGSSVKDLSQARLRLSSAEEMAKKGTSLDLYLILGISASDPASEIKKAYRKAALRHHPDKAGQFLVRSESRDDGKLWKEITEKVHRAADRLFKMIGEAYAVLSDPTKRAEYDLEEELRKAQESKGSSAPRRPDFYSSPFGRSDNRQYWQESRKTYGNSHSQW